MDSPHRQDPEETLELSTPVTVTYEPLEVYKKAWDVRPLHHLETFLEDNRQCPKSVSQIPSMLARNSRRPRARPRCIAWWPLTKPVWAESHGCRSRSGFCSS